MSPRIERVETEEEKQRLREISASETRLKHSSLHYQPGPEPTQVTFSESRDLR